MPWGLAAVHPPAASWLITLLQATLLALVAIGATMVVLMRHPVRQVVVFSTYGRRRSRRAGLGAYRSSSRRQSSLLLALAIQAHKRFDTVDPEALS